MITRDTREMRAGPPLSEYTVGILGYPASTSDTLSIAQVANRLLTELDDKGVFDNYNQIFFICHSLGGLVMKEIIHELNTKHDDNLKKIAAVFLISTPSQGTPAANFISGLPSMISMISGRLIIDLHTIDNNTYLQSLEEHWQEILRNRKNRMPLIYCAYETQKTGPITVVSQTYTATICDETPRAENANHIEIVKPRTTEDSIYEWVRGRIASIQKMPKQDGENWKDSRKEVAGRNDDQGPPEVSTSPATVVDNKTCATDDPPITCLFRNP